MTQGRGQGASGLLPAYLAVGGDELKRETAVSRMKARLSPGLAAFNLDEREANADMQPGDLVTSLNTIPVGDGFRLVLVHGAERLPKPVSEAIIAYLGNPNPGCVLLLDAASLAKSTRLYKAVAKVGPRSVIDCAPKKRWELSKTVVRMAAHYGATMTEAAATELISRVGESTTMLDRQVRSLADLCRGSGQIGLVDVEANVARTAEVKPWDFLDSVCARDAGKALSLYQLMNGASEIALLSLLTGRLRELVCARSLDARGEGARVASELHKQAWQVKNHVHWARGFAPGELESGLRCCAECERALKGGSDPRIAFTSLVVEVCGRGRR